jgi:hypothetical protein
MRKLLGKTIGGVLVCATFTLATATICQPVSVLAALPPADDTQAVEQVDHALVAALAKGDKAAAEKMFDAGLMWTNSAGETIGHAKVVAALPKPVLGDESGAKSTVRGYGPDVAAVQVASGKVHVLRIWTKRPAGWRLFVYHEVTQRTGAAPPPSATTNNCENPCKGVPYTAKDDAEKGILKSWGELETAVTNHDPKAWSPHFLDEFVLISSGAPDPVDKAGRMKQLTAPGVGPAPPQLAKTPAVKFIHFGDTVIMIAQANPYAGKPNHISRIWTKGDGTWRMAFSYQTTIQSAPEIVPPKS